jgi:glycosyltransferase involved in cell wall biosynthesis
MPVLEAMAAGVPVVAGNRSALPEVCGESAILVDPENEEQLAWAMNRIVSDETTAQRLTDAGIQRAAGFQWSAAVEKTVAIYREVAPEAG